MIESQSASVDDTFAAAFRHVRETREYLTTGAMQQRHGEIEARMLVAGREFARLMMQGHLDLRAQMEQLEARPAKLPAAAEAHTQKCKLETVVGEVCVTRRAWVCKGSPSVRPLDAELDLPRELYSSGVRRFACEQIADRSIDHACAALRALGINVPKRQAEQLVVRMAQDFDAFYEERPHPANDTTSDETLLVLSVDAKGVPMVQSALREATRKAAEKDAAARVVRGDPMAARKERNHDRRMAVVTAIWDQARCVREPEDILEQLKPPAQRNRAERRLARPANKRVAATVEQDQNAAVGEMFDEAQRRDPDYRCTWVVLLDGAESQAEAVQREADRRGVRVVIVLDLIHVLHYLWGAAKAIFGTREVEAEGWVRTYVGKLLTRPVVDVAAGIRQSATLNNVQGDARKAVEKCAEYLRARSRHLDYATALREGFPIASGVIEGACRSLVQDRMGITGARWTVATAEAVLRVRALMASGDWEAYCRFHVAKEHARNYPVAAAA